MVAHRYLIIMTHQRVNGRVRDRIIDIWAKISQYPRYRGSYMSAHILLNLLNELGKRNKMRGLPSILSLFRNEFNKVNYSEARMLDSIYHMT